MDKPKLLFVDDRRKRIHSALRKYGQDYEVEICPNVKETLRAIAEQNWDVVSLDHDLNGEDFQDPNEKTCGMEIIRHILGYGWPYTRKPLFVIHTGNIFAGNVMRDSLSDNGHHVILAKYEYNESVIEWMPLCKRSQEPLSNP